MWSHFCWVSRWKSGTERISQEHSETASVPAFPALCFQLSSYISFPFPIFHSSPFFVASQKWFVLFGLALFSNKIIRKKVEQKFSQVFQQIINSSSHFQDDSQIGTASLPSDASLFNFMHPCCKPACPVNNKWMHFPSGRVSSIILNYRNCRRDK